ncbi:MAG: hypothetical protein ACYSW8_05120 [Planctomycetota bacterium]
MESRKKSARGRLWTILCAVAAIMLSAVPCARADETVPAGVEKDIDYEVSGNLFAYGTVNMLPGADIEWSVYTADTTVLNITGGAVGAAWPGLMTISVAPGAQVTVYGTTFAIDGVPQAPGSVAINGDLTVDAGLATEFTLPIGCVDDATVTLEVPGGGGPIPVQIDIKPGSDDNTINLGSNGVIPVAILSTADFDATAIDADTVSLAGAGVAVRGKGNKALAHQEDVNGDGLLDLVVKVETENLDPGTFQDGGAILQVIDPASGDVLYEGWDSITIVPE